MIRRLHILKNHLKSYSTNKDETIFDLILNKKIPSTVVYEDDKIYAFNDVNPQAPIHVLIIPKNKNGLTGISQAEEKDLQILGYMLIKAKVIANKLELKQGYRLIINEGKNGQQTVSHLHMHLLGGRQLNWPPG